MSRHDHGAASLLRTCDLTRTGQRIPARPARLFCKPIARARDIAPQGQAAAFKFRARPVMIEQ